MAEERMSSLMTALAAHEKEVNRLLILIKGWPTREVARVVVGWLGTERAKEMNDFLGKSR